ncbi:MAG TPA: hypothetical protein VM389_08975 [Phycisphaerae bacterium]|nr:hypothetical protein [Phycisphaerae bacterium]
MDRETDILARLMAGEVSLPPVALRVLGFEPAGGGRVRAEAFIEASWEGQVVRFLVEAKALATPKALRQAIAVARDAASPPEAYPMVVVPYLSPGKLDELEAAGVSGLDLCGNGVLVVPGRMLVFRSGRPNRFPQSVKIKNVYRGKNSLVARAFLIQPEYPQVKDIVGLLKQRGGSVAFSTVSKALKRLEEDLVLSREGDTIRLLQADVLLDRLAANYEPPDLKERYRGKCGLPVDEIVRGLASVVSAGTGKLVMTGAASGERYATMAREPMVSLYVSVPPGHLLAASGIDVKETERFANLEILWTADARVFFDPRVEDGLPFASPIQAYLELVTGDKRQKDAAEQVRRGILAPLGKV